MACCSSGGRVQDGAPEFGQQPRSIGGGITMHLKVCSERLLSETKVWHPRLEGDVRGLQDELEERIKKTCRDGDLIRRYFVGFRSEDP